jgi:hypothetical protein
MFLSVLLVDLDVHTDTLAAITVRMNRALFSYTMGHDLFIERLYLNGHVKGFSRFTLIAATLNSYWPVATPGLCLPNPNILVAYLEDCRYNGRRGCNPAIQM